MAYFKGFLFKEFANETQNTFWYFGSNNNTFCIANRFAGSYLAYVLLRGKVNVLKTKDIFIAVQFNTLNLHKCLATFPYCQTGKLVQGNHKAK